VQYLFRDIAVIINRFAFATFGMCSLQEVPRKLIAIRVGHYLLTIGKGHSLCYLPPVPACLEESVLANHLRPHLWSFFSPAKLQNDVRSLPEFKHLAPTRYKRAFYCQTLA
jgi:hypothetical protein